jgi:PAS domain S-box-containing protein
VDLVLLGSAMWLARQNRLVLFAQVLAALVVVSGLFGLIGYGYGVSSFYRLGHFTAIAVNTSAAFVALGLGVMAGQPDSGIMAPFSQHGTAGRIIRWSLLAAALLPVALGCLNRQAQRMELYDANFGDALMVLALFAVLVAGIWWTGIQLKLVHREGERASDKQLAELRAALDEHAIVAITDPQGRITFVNDKFCRISKYSREELLGQDHRIVNSGQHSVEFMRNLWTTIGNGKIWHGQIQNKAKDATFYWVDTTIVPFLNEDGKPRQYVAIHTDITEGKRAEEERQQFDRKLQETQRLESLGVLAGGIAHDFNNILTGILGNASLARVELPIGSPVQHNLNAIAEASVRASDLCKQMLAYSGRGGFVVKNISLNQIVEESIHLLELSISKKAVLRFNLFPELPAIEADATQIRQVIMNLVINASDAIGEKSGVISLNTGVTRVDRAYLGGTVFAPELPEGEYVHLEVSDSGCGMTAEVQARIFDPFFTTKFTGRGLGLSAVLGIMRGHHGAIKTYSEPGRGTTFKLLFPCVAGAPEPTPAGRAIKVPWRGRGRILIVDDEESVRSTAAAMLKRLGFEVALAADGREAVDAFRAEPDGYALVLMDLTMPHLNGEQTFTELRRIKPDVQVVLTSGYNEQEAVSRFTGKGLASFLQKPFEYEGLQTIVQRVLDGGADPARPTTLKS